MITRQLERIPTLNDSQSLSIIEVKRCYVSAGSFTILHSVNTATQLTWGRLSQRDGTTLPIEPTSFIFVESHFDLWLRFPEAVRLVQIGNLTKKEMQSLHPTGLAGTSVCVASCDITARLFRVLVDYLEADSSAMNGPLLKGCICALTRRMEADERQLLYLSKMKTRRMNTFIDENIETNIEVKDIASIFNLSVGHFTRQFTRQFGISPYKYVTNRRIERATTFLADTTAPLAEVSLAVGFSNQSHMSKVFRSQVGMTPRQYRLQFSRHDSERKSTHSIDPSPGSDDCS